MVRLYRLALASNAFKKLMTIEFWKDKKLDVTLKLRLVLHRLHASRLIKVC